MDLIYHRDVEWCGGCGGDSDLDSDSGSDSMRGGRRRDGLVGWLRSFSRGVCG